MNEECKIQFHACVNGKDAEPFAKDGLMVVADGSFAASLKIPNDSARIKFTSQLFKDLSESALDGLDPSRCVWLKEYLDLWINGIENGRFGSTVSVAAYIAIIRLLFALMEQPGYLENLDDIEARTSLTAFISEGLSRAVGQFGFAEASETEQLLPVALSAISYLVEDETVTAEVLWSGESRAYALTQTGLRLLADSQSGSGEYILANGAYKPLSYCKTKLPLPCVLVTVTDGVTAPFAPEEVLGTEAVLLDNLSRCENAGAFGSALKGYYEELKYDDAAMAFIPLGFSSFDELKEAFLPRSEQVISLWNRYYASRMQSETSELSDYTPDWTAEFVKQTDERLDAIIEKLADAYFENTEDFLLKKVGIPYVSSAIARKKEELKTEVSPSAVLEKIKEFLKDYNNCEDVTGFALAGTCPRRIPIVLGAAFDNLKNAAENLAAAKRIFDDRCRRQSVIVASERDVVELMNARRADILKERERMKRERNENVEQQNEIFHFKMARLNEKIAWATGEQARLNEQYRQSCNPYICRYCDSRCPRFAVRGDALSVEIRSRMKEKESCVDAYYTYRDQYTRLKNEFVRFENRDSALEQEDVELERLLHAYQLGNELKPGGFQSGSARNFCERINNQAGNRKQITRYIKEAEKPFNEQKLIYDSAVKAFFYSGLDIMEYVEILFRPQFLADMGYADGRNIYGENQTREHAAELIRSEFARDKRTAVDDILQAFSAHCYETSIADSCYDAALLTRFRNDCRLTTGKTLSEADCLKKELQEYRRGCRELLN